MSKILSKIGKKKELLERKIGGKKSKIGSGITYNIVLNLLRVEEINPEYMLE